MSRTAENLLEEFNLARQQQDEFAVQIYKKTLQEQTDGKLADEIEPTEWKKKKEFNLPPKIEVVHC